MRRQIVRRQTRRRVVAIATEQLGPTHSERLRLRPALGTAGPGPHLASDLARGAVTVECERQLLTDLLAQRLTVDGRVATRIPHELQHRDEDGKREAADEHHEDATHVVHVQGGRFQALALVLALTWSVVVPPLALEVLQGERRESASCDFCKGSNGQMPPSPLPSGVMSFRRSR